MWTRLNLARVGPLAAAACLFLLVAGCASGPGGRVASAPTGQVPRNADRDGPPSDAPPDLIGQPDAVPQVEPIKPGGPNKPYTVLGQSYEPVVQDLPLKERGVASWYGTKFHGRKTASGELFSMYSMTAAHRTLPIPSYARVRNVANGKEVIVRVNDRGPFHSSRVLDLSYAAALKLGVISTGSATVEVERLTFDEIRSGAWRKNGTDDAVAIDAPVAQPVAPADALAALPLPSGTSGSASAPLPLTPSATDRVAEASPAVARAYTTPAQGYWVQVAALSKREGVERLQQRMAGELSALTPMMAVFHEMPLFKLQLGPFASKDEAHAAARQVRDALQISPMVLQRR